MPSGRNRVVAESSDQAKVIRRVAPLEFYVVDFVDGTGQSNTRVVGRVGKSSKFYFPFPEGTERNFKHAAAWMNEGLSAALDKVTSLPSEPASDLPTGDLLEDGDGV
jgi:hypothetical protein